MIKDVKGVNKFRKMEKNIYDKFFFGIYIVGFNLRYLIEDDYFFFKNWADSISTESCLFKMKMNY